jgi:predicted DsbA family dithiol-disulfide isomerase
LSKRSSRGYFEHEQDVGSHEFLAKCAEKAGVFSAEETRTFLAGTELKDNVGKDIMQVVSADPDASGIHVLIANRCFWGAVRDRGQQGE